MTATSDQTTMANQTDHISGLDGELRVLVSRRRRDVVRALDRQKRLSKSALADYVARVEHGENFDPAERKSVWVSLHQTHLPTLLESGAIVQVDDGVFSPGPVFDQVRDALARLEDREDEKTKEGIRGVFGGFLG